MKPTRNYQSRGDADVTHPLWVPHSVHRVSREKTRHMEHPEARAYAATKQHVALIVAKRDKLEEALLAAEEQYALAVARDWAAGNLTWHELQDAYRATKANRLPQFSRRWADAGLPHQAKIAYVVNHLPVEADGSWRGTNPIGKTDRTPPPGSCVVYVLFADDLTPCYVGSTQHFAPRMSGHRSDGKLWSSWVAYPCRDREHAYQVEESFLAEYMPGLNKKAGR